MAGLVAMVSVFVVVTIEMFFAMKGARHVHGNEYDRLIEGAGRDSLDDADEYAQSPEPPHSTEHLRDVRGNNNLHKPFQDTNTSSENLINGCVADEAEDKDDDIELQEMDPFADDESQVQEGRHINSQSRNTVAISNHSYDHRSDSGILTQNPQKRLLQCLLLEAGILFHSIFIGMALSVATGTSFIVLLVAISLHQTFEGFALGSRIASLIPDLFSPSSAKPWLMACAYGTTTPIGQAIGLILHNLYDPASTTGLLMVGLTNAISSGLLLFAGLVELLAEDFLSDSSYKTLRGNRRIEACISVATGAMLMALVGAWA